MSVRVKNFSYLLDPEGKITLRSSFSIRSGKIERFAVQLEFENRPVVRFDNAHGYVHQHTFKPNEGSETRRLKFVDEGQAYSYCYQFIKHNWKNLINQFKGYYEK